MKNADPIAKVNPIAEVFGFPPDNRSKEADEHREKKLCPFQNDKKCTKSKANDPLGVCSVKDENTKVIICPSRFRESDEILKKAASFVWPNEEKWDCLPEVKLNDADEKSAGNIDYVIVKYGEDDKIIDFASIEVQGVYISGNLRNPFKEYTETDYKWDGKEVPHPDYLSSSRKRLIPQMLYKGGIFKKWGKKQCVVIQKSFFDKLPKLHKVSAEDAEIAWFLYDLEYNEQEKKNHLVCKDTVYTKFDDAMNEVICPKTGDMEKFVKVLEKKNKEIKKNNSVKKNK